MPFIWVQLVNNGVHQYRDYNHQVDDGELGALEDYQATDFISIFQKVKLALNLLVTFFMKYRKNCECCPGHCLIVNHCSSMS